jgi:hypothetical protein
VHNRIRITDSMRRLNLIDLRVVFREVHNFLQSEALAKAVSFSFVSWSYEIVPMPQQENGNIWFAFFFVLFFNHIISY